MSDLEAQLEAVLRKLPIAPASDQGIPYATLIPGIVRQLALMKSVACKPASVPMRRLSAINRHAKALCGSMAMPACLPLDLRLLVVQLAHANIPDLPAGSKGAPAKVHARKVAWTVAEHYYGLTGNRPTRITPLGGGKTHSPFISLLATVYRLLGIKASAGNQAKSAIKFINEKYPRR